MKTALITGATGFIGYHLARRLIEDGWRVHVLLRPSSDERKLPAGTLSHRHGGDLPGLVAILQDAQPDVVFHLASLYLADHRPDDVDALVTSNILFPTQLAQAMTETGVTRLVNTGTAWQHYGDAAYDPVNLYAATKQACGDLLAYFHAARGLSLITLKLFDSYGLGDTRRKLVSLLIDAAHNRTQLGMSPGDQTVDLTHVDDIVEAFAIAGNRLCATGDRVNETYFVSGERFVVRDLVNHVARVLSTPIDVEFGARPHRQREVMMPKAPGVPLPEWSRRNALADILPALSEERLGKGT